MATYLCKSMSTCAGEKTAMTVEDSKEQGIAFEEQSDDRQNTSSQSGYVIVIVPIHHRPMKTQDLTA